MRFPQIRVADGTLLYAGEAGELALDVATDEDWGECLTRARMRLANGSARIEPGLTLEETLAEWAAKLLHRGIPGVEAAMGRTPDAAEWAAQQARWEQMVHQSAALHAVTLEQRKNASKGP